MKLPRTVQKAIRDLAVLAGATVLLALAERAGDFGVPVEAIPVVSAAALALYRLLRASVGREPA